ncbi:hypothetical protein PMAYCL1PPCAC_22530, partial [Pristionchus mayeri]
RAISTIPAVRILCMYTAFARTAITFVYREGLEPVNLLVEDSYAIPPMSHPLCRNISGRTEILCM